MNKTILASLLAVGTLAPIACFAFDGTVDLNGSLINQTCVINGGAPSFTVTLPKVSVSSLNAANQSAGTTNFTITLTGCTADVGARAYFESGAGVDASTNRLINTGTAKNVQVRLLNAAGGTLQAGLGTGAQNSGNYVPIVAGQATLVYGARYVTTYAGAATPGTVRASVTYYLEYM